MKHLMVNVTGFVIVGPYTLRVIFNNGAERIINFAPVLAGYTYAPLRNVDFFNQVRLDPEVHTLVWPNDADFDPATLYNWDQGDGVELAQRVAYWDKAGADRRQSNVKVGYKPGRVRPNPAVQPAVVHAS